MLALGEYTEELLDELFVVAVRYRVPPWLLEMIVRRSHQAPNRDRHDATIRLPGAHERLVLPEYVS